MGIKGIIEKVIGTYSDRELKKIYPITFSYFLYHLYFPFSMSNPLSEI